MTPLEALASTRMVADQPKLRVLEKPGRDVAWEPGLTQLRHTSPCMLGDLRGFRSENGNWRFEFCQT